MFDLSFFEMIVIGVVALIVIGPEKLPTVARTAGKLVGRLQRFVTQVKDEVNEDARFEELQSLKQEITSGINKIQSDVDKEMSVIGDAIKVDDNPLSSQEPDVTKKAKKTASRGRVTKSTHKKASSPKRQGNNKKSNVRSADA